MLRKLEVPHAHVEIAVKSMGKDATGQDVDKSKALVFRVHCDNLRQFTCQPEEKPTLHPTLQDGGEDLPHFNYDDVERTSS